jgi:hypothetical protein
VQIVVSLVVVFSLAASAYLGIASARAILRAVGVEPPSLFPSPHHAIFAAAPHFMDPRVPEKIRNRIFMSHLLGSVGFLVAGTWILWRSGGGMGVLMIGVGVAALGAVALTYRRFKR